MKPSDPSTTYEQMGRAALLPGMVHMLEIMQRHLDEFKAQLAALQNGGEGIPPKRGRPPKPQGESIYARKGHTLPEKVGDDYTTVGAAKALGLATPSSFLQFRSKKAKTLGHRGAIPDVRGRVLLFTQRDLDRMRKLVGVPVVDNYRVKAGKNRWASMSKKERDEWQRRMQAGRNKPEKSPHRPTVPEKVGPDYTMTGVAKALGFAHAHSFENWRAKSDAPRGRRVKVKGVRSPVVLYSAEDLDTMRQMRAGKAAA